MSDGQSLALLNQSSLLFSIDTGTETVKNLTILKGIFTHVSR